MSALLWTSNCGLVAVIVFATLTIIMTQITSNTAAIAVTVPITISTFQSLDINPLPFVYIVAAVGNCGFMLPTSADWVLALAAQRRRWAAHPIC